MCKVASRVVLRVARETLCHLILDLIFTYEINALCRGTII